MLVFLLDVHIIDAILKLANKKLQFFIFVNEAAC